MDHHHHYSWRARPPPVMQGNSICPVCSISHFPFCPPAPSFHESPRVFQSHNNDYYFNGRPQFDHSPYYRGPNDNLHPVDGFGDRSSWHMDSSGPGYDHSNIGVKRMRADVTSENHVNYSNLGSEDERRLKLLIRDHGSASGALQSSNYDNNGYMQEKPILSRNIGKIDDGERVKSESLPLKPNINVEMYEFQNPSTDFNSHKHREEKSLGFGQQYMHTNGNEGFGHCQYDQIGNADVGRIGYKYNITDQYPSVPGMDDMRRPTIVSQVVHFPNPEAPNGSYQNHNVQRINHTDSLSKKEPHHSHWHGVEGSMDEQRSNFPVGIQNFDNQLPSSHRMQHPGPQNHDTRQSFGVGLLSEKGISSSYGQHELKKGGCPPIFRGTTAGPKQPSRVYDVQPPLPASPPPPLPMEPQGLPYPNPYTSSSPQKASLFPISITSSTDVPLSYPSIAEAQSAKTYYTDQPNRHTTEFSTENFQARQETSRKYLGEHHTFPLREIVPEKPKIVDASQIFKHPHRATRPDHIVIILRGLPGSGKSYLAKTLRDLEVEMGGAAPRIHSMDDYFMTEVEKVEDREVSKSSGSTRGRKPVVKKVMEFCYEPEMEEAYRSSMLKAFKKTLDEGVFSFIIVDDRNLRVADFAQFWATAKRSGFEVYLLEATYKDPAGCAARNLHGFTLDDIQKMAGQWEEASPMYLKLDIKSFLHGDDLEDGGIQEVDMDMEDGDPAGGISGSEERNFQNSVVPLVEYSESNGPPKDDQRWDAEDPPTEEVKELRSSKWSDDFDEADSQGTKSPKRNSSPLSGLIKAYSKSKSVSWGDKDGDMGFSIGAAKQAKLSSLLIGPGAGYNLKSNPLPKEDIPPSSKGIVEPKRHNIFQEQLRAERESFKAVFDKRRQRIVSLGTDEE